MITCIGWFFQEFFFIAKNRKRDSYVFGLCKQICVSLTQEPTVLLTEQLKFAYRRNFIFIWLTVFKTFLDKQMRSAMFLTNWNAFAAFVGQFLRPTKRTNPLLGKQILNFWQTEFSRLVKAFGKICASLKPRTKNCSNQFEHICNFKHKIHVWSKALRHGQFGQKDKCFW